MVDEELGCAAVPHAFYDNFRVMHRTEEEVRLHAAAEVAAATGGGGGGCCFVTVVVVVVVLFMMFLSALFLLLFYEGEQHRTFILCFCSF